jgi:protein-tyrosine-phosphatase
MSEADGVLFVCTGNTCRSPLAEALWQLVTRDLPGSSAGVAAWPGMPAADHAVDVARAFGVSLDAHRSRRLEDVTEPVRLVLAMTEDHRRRILQARPMWDGRVHLLTEAAGSAGDIGDPIGSSVEVYRSLAEQLLHLEEEIWRRMRAGLS